MEGDGPSCAMVLYEYSRLLETLGKLKESSKNGILEAMFDPMIKVATKYKDLALKCEPILMATILHPAWRLLLFANKFQSHHRIAQDLISKKFKERQALLKLPTPPSTKESSQAVVPEDDEYNFYPKNSALDDSEDELNRYYETKYTLGIKGNVLLWWKTQAPSFPILSSLARDYLACASSSATVERTFSAASDICTTARSALAPQKIEWCISSHLWIRNGVQAQGGFDDCVSVMAATKKNPKFNPASAV
ncbi:hypothetical protein PGTUg99_023338 [Puccinia graminis f. sp. tritici]|uniref:HAT C-terminal dimerisation domain-containing protein n=1 Tax=Puccinia graminis f. sp. tritici TaxID=56615 RepID=A0A5B0PPZ3_PUCGR|nr:hypothetical protein PGTUg99_023338 [Puccinia graminis f. sp. tritici]